MHGHYARTTDWFCLSQTISPLYISRPRANCQKNIFILRKLFGLIQKVLLSLDSKCLLLTTLF